MAYNSRRKLPEIKRDQLTRLSYAHDASIYRLVPQGVIKLVNESEVTALLEYCTGNKTGVTFRAGGTSLSGQTVTSGLVAEITTGWTAFKVLDDGAAIMVQPGVIGEHANRALQPYQRRIGPDPASIKAARMGGIIANNASGMSSGVGFNSYYTMGDMRFILPDGNLFDTAYPNARQRFKQEESLLAKKISALRDEILLDTKLKDKVEHKYRIKNTLGYSLNAFLDYEHPLDIFTHLLIGSEGTLAFISSVTLNTLPEPACKSAGLLLFNSAAETCRAIPVLNQLGADAVELMDYNSLLTAKYLDDPPYDPQQLPNGAAALLCEFHRDTAAELEQVVGQVNRHLKKINARLAAGFHSDETRRLQLWQVRKSLFTTVGSMRRPGTSVITEDICFDVASLADVIDGLHAIFHKWHYEDAVIFGHARDGNLHFVAAIDLASSEGIEAYEGMLDDVAALTVKRFDGSLKAEHGTGRNMAPYVEQEWGPDLYDIMWRIKKAADPNRILNPGVLLNRDSKTHISDLKPMPLVNPAVDLCVECGFCEPTCPSRNFTLTPRSRITLAREIEMMQKGKVVPESLIKAYNFSGTDTCAVDGLCETACPVNINTGGFVKELRIQHHSAFQTRIALWTTRHFQAVQSLLRPLLSIQWYARQIRLNLLVGPLMKIINRLSGRAVPAWNTRLPKGAPLPGIKSQGGQADYVYYTSCINRTFSAREGKSSLTAIVNEIAEVAGINLMIPPAVGETCCGTPYSSKGYHAAYQSMAIKTVQMLYAASDRGRLPVIVDTSPCTYQFKTMVKHVEDRETQRMLAAMQFMDIVPFLAELLGNFNHPPLPRKVVLHPTCSTQKMGEVETMVSLARQCAREVQVPPDYGCCAFAGDRGMLIPELTASATATEAEQVRALDSDYQGISSSRTCEIGMMTATERDYESVAILVRDYLHSRNQ